MILFMLVFMLQWDGFAVKQVHLFLLKCVRMVCSV